MGYDSVISGPGRGTNRRRDQLACCRSRPRDPMLCECAAQSVCLQTAVSSGVSALWLLPLNVQMKKKDQYKAKKPCRCYLTFYWTHSQYCTCCIIPSKGRLSHQTASSGGGGHSKPLLFHPVESDFVWCDLYYCLLFSPLYFIFTRVHLRYSMSLNWTAPVTRHALHSGMRMSKINSR